MSISSIKNLAVIDSKFEEKSNLKFKSHTCVLIKHADLLIIYSIYVFFFFNGKHNAMRKFLCCISAVLVTVAIA